MVEQRTERRSASGMYEDKENAGDSQPAKGKRIANGTTGRAPLAVR